TSICTKSSSSRVPGCEHFTPFFFLVQWQYLYSLSSPVLLICFGFFSDVIRQPHSPQLNNPANKCSCFFGLGFPPLPMRSCTRSYSSRLIIGSWIPECWTPLKLNAPV